MLLRAAHALARRRYPHHVHPVEGCVGAAPGVLPRHTQRGPYLVPRHELDVVELYAVSPIGVAGVRPPDAPADLARVRHGGVALRDLRPRPRLRVDARVCRRMGSVAPPACATARAFDRAPSRARMVPSFLYSASMCRCAADAASKYTREVNRAPIHPSVEITRVYCGAAPPGSPEHPPRGSPVPLTTRDSSAGRSACAGTDACASRCPCAGCRHDARAGDCVCPAGRRPSIPG